MLLVSSNALAVTIVGWSNILYPAHVHFLCNFVATTMLWLDLQHAKLLLLASFQACRFLCMLHKRCKTCWHSARCAVLYKSVETST